jgi:hypothetical protein
MTTSTPPTNFTDMAQRAIFHDPPPAGFEPLKASAQQLAAFHLPEQPNRLLLLSPLTLFEGGAGPG